MAGVRAAFRMSQPELRAALEISGTATGSTETSATLTVERADRAEPDPDPDAPPRGQIPVINRSRAGAPIDYTEWGATSREGYRYIPCPHWLDWNRHQGDLFALVCEGNSMSPDIEPDDEVIFRGLHRDQDGDWPPVADNTVVHVRFDALLDHGVTIARWVRQPDGLILLHKRNPDHVSMAYPVERFDQLAVCAGVFKRRV